MSLLKTLSPPNQEIKDVRQAKLDKLKIEATKVSLSH